MEEAGSLQGTMQEQGKSHAGAGQVGVQGRGWCALVRYVLCAMRVTEQKLAVQKLQNKT